MEPSIRSANDRKSFVGSERINRLANFRKRGCRQAERKKEPVNRKCRRVCCEEKPHDQLCFQQLIPWTLPLLRKTPQAI